MLGTVALMLWYRRNIIMRLLPKSGSNVKTQSIAMAQHTSLLSANEDFLRDKEGNFKLVFF